MPIIITRDTVWTPGSVHTLTDEVQIAEGVTLTIQPGAVVNGGSFRVFGRLAAAGNEYDSVSFNGTSVTFGNNYNRPGAVTFSNVEMNGGKFLPAGGDATYGSFQIDNSHFASVGGLYIWYPTGPSQISDSVFDNSQALSTGLNGIGTLVLSGNVFNHSTGNFYSPTGTAIENWAAYNNGLLVAGNVFNTKYAIVLPEGYNSARAVAENNYFGATSATAIAEMILDRNDSLTRASFIDYDPFLTAPPANQPTYGTSGADMLAGTEGSDYIVGWRGDDILKGLAGDDKIVGGRGFNLVDGGAGQDSILVSGLKTSTSVLQANGKTYLVMPGETDEIAAVESITFSDGAVLNVAGAASNLPSFDSLAYIASHADLRTAFGADAQAGLDHFLSAGAHEGRSITFDAWRYLASYADLRSAFGSDVGAAASHYITNGAAEGRGVTFDAYGYLASYEDLRNAFGSDVYSAERHFVVAGAAEGRTITFDALAYTASYADLRAAFGVDVLAAERHFVTAGSAEGRTISFDAWDYLATYSDLRAAFGTDLTSAERHFITDGAMEGRVSAFDEVGYLLSSPDLGAAHLGATAALRHWVQFGAAEGRSGDAAFGREQTGHSLTLGSNTFDSFDVPGDHDWFQFAASSGERIEIDYQSANSDALLELHRSDGSLVSGYAVAHSAGHAQTLTYTADSSDIYYLTLADASGHGTGAYSVDFFLV